MLKSKIVASVLAAALALSPISGSAGLITPTPPPSSSSAVPVGIWLIFGCASGIIFAAAIANARDKRELTQSEAITCGLLFWLNPAKPR